MGSYRTHRGVGFLIWKIEITTVHTYRVLLCSLSYLLFTTVEVRYYYSSYHTERKLRHGKVKNHTDK